MGDVIFLTGPVRSGKSRHAVELARNWGDQVVFVATYRVDPRDHEMADRVRRHQDERPATWRTLEAPEDAAAAVTALSPPPSAVIVDSLVVWAADRFHQTDPAIIDAWQSQLEAWRAADYPVIIVGDEIGWAPVPLEPELRRFRDLVGTLGQRTAAMATAAWLVVAGCPLRLK
jgi:adenosylcobinamide kinase / adenosylcobinamide-phosphate guanylyltransferase